VLPEQGQWPGSQYRSSAESWQHGVVASSAQSHRLGHWILPVGGGYSPAKVATANGAAARRVVATATLGFIPAITPGAVGGLLIGIVLCAVCCVLLIAYLSGISQPGPSWRHFAQRNPGRHVAPSASIGVGPMAAKFAVRPLPVRN
jgi:hypothetical protein